MKVQPLPKPTYRKHKAKKYPALFTLGFCWNCSRTYGLERHHIYGGNPDRQHSEIWGIYVDLCRNYTIYEGNKPIGVIGCHTKVTDELDKELCTRLKREGQRRFEQEYGRDEFMRVFGRSYL